MGAAAAGPRGAGRPNVSRPNGVDGSAEPVDVAALPVDATGHRSVGWWGTLLLIATEAALFAYLLVSYLYLSSMARGSLFAGYGPPELRLALPATFVLAASSGTVWWAESGMRRGNGTRLGVGLGLTLLLGGVFLAIQLHEYAQLPFRPQSDAYGSLFWTITGFHGAHVLIGLLALGVVLLRCVLGHFTSERHLAVTNVGMYWHFVDVVWLFVFTTLYLSPRFG